MTPFQRLSPLISGLLLSLAAVPAFAASAELNAQLGIARAQASIDLVSKENPAQTRDRSFTDAQQRLADARIAAEKNHDREALWLASEAELLADVTAGSAKLAGLQHTRAEVAHGIEILNAEIRK